MNIQDGSKDAQMLKDLQTRKQTLLDAQALKGQKPIETKPPNLRVFIFDSHRNARKAHGVDYNSVTTFIPPAYPPCANSYENLRKITIQELVLETHHRGTYIALRSVTSPDKMSAVSTMAQDETGNVVYLAIYYQEHEHVEEFLGKGAIVIIKDPFLKVFTDGCFGIRVDHLSDVRYLAPCDILTPAAWQPRIWEQSANHWREEGNVCFKYPYFYRAIEHYSQGLLCSPDGNETRIIRLNRALAFLKTGHFDGALSDIEAASKDQTTTEKGLFRKSQALYSLGRFNECHEVLKTLREEYPLNPEAKIKLEQTVSRIAEQDTGVYDFKRLYVEAAKLRPPHLDHATYIGPVEVRTAGAQGRGLFTTTAVKAGELLLCEKAFAHSFLDTKSKKSSRNVQTLFNLETNSITIGTQANLIGIIARKIFKNPSLASAITDLHHGSYQPLDVSDVDGKPIVDSFLIERIITLNVFGCPLTTRELRIGKTSTREEHARDEIFHSTGIWVKASYLNHSCCPNTIRCFIGDMMLIRASQDIPANTELTQSYRIPKPTDPPSIRQSQFKHWNFECKCNICQDEKETAPAIFQKRISLRSQLVTILEKPSLVLELKKVNTLLADMASTYNHPPRRIPRLAMWDLLLSLGKHYWTQQKLTLAIEACMRCLASLGYTIEGGKKSPLVIKQWGLMQELLMECWIIISLSYEVLGNTGCAVVAMEYAKLTYTVFIGEGDSFEESCGKTAGAGSVAGHSMMDAALGG